MSRQYETTEIIRFPRMNAGETVVLGRQLLTAADAQQAALADAGSELPLFIARPLARMRTRVELLENALGPREAQDPQVRMDADSAVDLGWSLVRSWMDSQLALPESLNPRLEDLSRLYEVLFPDGLSFLTLSYREEWAESESRLNYIHEHGFASMFQELGGQVYLENLEQAHARYGEVLGITAPVAEPAPEGVMEEKKAAIAAMKVYVFKVLAWADPEEPGSEALSEALLVPLVAWDDSVSTAGVDDPAQQAADGSAQEGSSGGPDDSEDAPSEDAAPA